MRLDGNGAEVDGRGTLRIGQPGKDAGIRRVNLALHLHDASRLSLKRMRSRQPGSLDGRHAPGRAGWCHRSGSIFFGRCLS